MSTNENNMPVELAVLRDSDDREAFLDFRWTDGEGHMQSVSIGLDLGTHDGGQQGLRDNVWTMLQHVYVMGAAEYAEPNRVQNERIQTLMAEREQDEGTIARLQARVGELEAQVHAAEEQASDLIKAQAEADAKVPTVEPVHGERAVTIYRPESNFNVQPWGAMTEDWTADGLAAKLRGALADAYHAGRDSMHAEDRQLIESYRETAANDGARIEELVGQLGRTRRELEESQRQRQLVIEDWEHWQIALLEKAVEMRWCEQYEEFVDEHNGRTSILRLLAREKDWTVTITCEVSPMVKAVYEHIASIPTIPQPYDESTSEDATVDFYFTVTCREDDLRSQITELRRHLLGADAVVRVVEDDYEEAG